MMKYFPLCFVVVAALAAAVLANPVQVVQDPLLFSTGDSDFKIATAARISPEVESADDFALTNPVSITGMKFQGLITNAGSDWHALVKKIKQVNIEMYLVFPLLSKETEPNRIINRTTFETKKVVTRLNSPSDEVLFERDHVTYDVKLIKQQASVPLSIHSQNIKPKPNQQQKLSGASGVAVEFSVKFDGMPFPKNGHWFAVPQVDIDGGEFLWLSAPKPLAVSTGKGFPAGVADLQSWIRNDPGLAPDWERIGTDVVGGGAAFNSAFKIYGK